MAVLLVLRDPELPEAGFADDLADEVVHVHGRKHGVRKLVPVACQAAKTDVETRAAREAVEIVDDEGARELDGAVLAVVEMDDAVAGSDRRERLAVGPGDQGRLHELVGFDQGVLRGRAGGAGRDGRVGAQIRLVDRGLGRDGTQALAVHQAVVRALNAIPIECAVHRVVAAHDRGDRADADRRHLLLEPVDVGERAPRRRIAAVGEDVHENARQALPARELEQRVEMLFGRVHALILQQPHEMQRRAVLLALLDHRQQRGMPEELAALDQLVDAHDLLLDDTARPHVEVADFRRALIAGAQADGAAGGTEDRVGIGGEDVGEDVGTGEGDGVTGVLVPDAPPVAHDQDDRGAHGTDHLSVTGGTVHV